MKTKDWMLQKYLGKLRRTRQRNYFRGFKNWKKSSIKDILLESLANITAKFSSGEEQLKAISELGGFLSAKSLETLTGLKESNDEK